MSAAYVVLSETLAERITVPESPESAALSVLRQTGLGSADSPKLRRMIYAKLRRMAVGDRVVLRAAPGGPQCHVERVA
jgi:hypothetical protein